MPIELPSEKMIKAGEEIASILYDVSIDAALDGSVDFEAIPEKYRDITRMFWLNEINSATGIYLAMNQEKL